MQALRRLWGHRAKETARWANSQDVQVAGHRVEAYDTPWPADSLREQPKVNPEGWGKRAQVERKGTRQREHGVETLCISQGQELSPGTHDHESKSNSSSPLGHKTPTNWKQKHVFCETYFPALAIRMAM